MHPVDRFRQLVALFPRWTGVWLTLSAIAVIALASKLRHGMFDPPVAAAARLTNNSDSSAVAGRADHYAWLSRSSRKAYVPLFQRITPPQGFVPIAVAPGSFGDWLRALPVRPPDAPVLDGKRGVALPASSPQVAAVIDLQPSNRNVLNAPNMAVRLRAEYLWHAQAFDRMTFSFTNGTPFSWAQWSTGQRPIVSGRDVTWSAHGPSDSSRTSYAAYLDMLFKYASIHSLVRDTQPVRDGTIQPGDVFVQTARPGHAVVVLDVATDGAGRVNVLLGQGGTPAVTFYVVRGSAASAWFDLRQDRALAVPGAGTLRCDQLRRW